MIITLYKGVELRSDYSVIFDCDQDFWIEESSLETPFARYLTEKQSVVREIENTYFKNDGVLSIDWTVFDGDYEGFTYMSVLLDTGETKYFFIDSYEYLNEMLRINYSIDVWHTYSNKMKIYNGVIGRANRELDGLRRALPIAYETNKALTFNPLTDYNNFYILAEYSVFLTQSKDEVDDAVTRQTYCSLVTHNKWTASYSKNTNINAPTTLSPDADFTFNYEDAIDTINKLTAYQGVQPIGADKQLGANWTGAFEALNPTALAFYKDKMDLFQNNFIPGVGLTEKAQNDFLQRQRYEIIQFYLLPYELFTNISNIFHVADNSPVNASILILDSVLTGSDVAETNNSYSFSEYQFLSLKSATQLNTTTTTITLPAQNDNSIVGIGLKSLFIPYSWNGLNSSYNFTFTVSHLGFSLVMAYEDGIIDLTDQFEVPLPFTTPSATEKQLAVLARQQAKAQLLATGASFAAMTATGALGMIGGLPALGSAVHNTALDISAATAVPRAWSTGRKFKQISSDLFTYGAQGAGEIGKTLSPIANQGVGLVYTGNSLINAVNALKSPINIGEAQNSTPNALINAQFGFGYYTMEPSNADYVNLLVKKIGYNVFIESNDYHHEQDADSLDGQYEPIQFTIAQVSGPFSNDVRAALEAILLEGAIISYDPDIFTKL